MNNNIYFKTDENFNEIISNKLSDKKILNMTKVSTGWTNIVYEVETNKGDFFFRFPRDEFWSRTIVKDYEFSKYIHGKTDFNTIELKLLYDNERPFSMHKKIPGISLAEKMNELNEDTIVSICDEIAEFMYQLHCIEYSKDKIFTVNNIGLNLKEFLNELLNIHVSTEDKKFWNFNKENLSQNNCLVHGDLNSSNILLDENNRVTAIIDFGFGGFGNIYDDLSRIIGRCPAKFKNKIVQSYEKYSTIKLNKDILDNNIDTWTNIDQGYINYMKKIGIYK